MYTTYREDYSSRGRLPKRRVKYMPTFKKICNQDLMKYIKDDIENSDKNIFTAEEFAKKYQTKPHKVRQIFHMLNLQGILSIRHNKPPHDCNREYMAWGGFSSWGAKIYYRMRKE